MNENENTQLENSQVVQNPQVSQSLLAKMFVQNGQLDFFKKISADYVEIKVPLPVKFLDPFKICMEVKQLAEHQIQKFGYQWMKDTEWLLGRYTTPCTSVEILIEKKENGCYYTFL